MKNFNTSTNNRRTCSFCNQTKQVKDFASAGKIKGIQYYRSRCKECYYIKKQDELNKVREEFRTFKQTLECSECHYSKKTNKRFVMEHLQFHHPKKNKLYNIGDLARRGVRLTSKKMQDELNKCIVLCGRCHDYEHYNHRNI